MAILPRHFLPLAFATLAQAQATDLVLVVHPTNPVSGSISASQLTDLAKGQMTHLGGRQVRIFIPKGTKSLQTLCLGVLKMSPLEYLQYAKSPKGGAPAPDVTFLDTVELVEATVKANPNAVGILAKSEVTATGLKQLPVK